MTVGPDDLLVSFDIVSLFTNIPVDVALQVIEREHKPDKHAMELIRHCMTSTYFVYNGQFYKQVKGAPMGSPLSPVVANLYLEYLEVRALDSAALKPRCWLRYIDDTFVIWQHGREKLAEFLEHLNGQHDNIKFTMELEDNNKLPFLDVLVYRKPDNSLGHTVYRKPTHTDRYLNAASHHHPSQIRSVANTLAMRSRRITDAHNLHTEARNFREALLRNGFPNRIILKAWNRRPRSQKDTLDEDKPTLVYLPYIKGTTDRIGKLLARDNIKTIFHTDRKIGSVLRSEKDQICLEGKGVYEIPCKDCSMTYVGQTGRNMFTRRQEHRLAVQQNASTSSLAQHVTQTKHVIDFDGMRSLATLDFLIPRLVREAIEIEKRPNNLNRRDDGRRLPHAWKPALSECRTDTGTINTERDYSGRPFVDLTANGDPANDDTTRRITRSQTMLKKRARQL